MARIRSLKPDLCLDERLADCDLQARLLFILMQPHCDDGGVHPAKPRTLRAEVFPHDEGITAGQVTAWMEQLIRAGLILEYQAAGESFWWVRDWAELQKVDKPNLRYPRPDDSASTRRQVAEKEPTPPVVLTDDSASTRRQVADSSPPDWKGGDRKGEEGSGAETSPKARRAPARKPSTPMPPDFGISDRVRRWAAERRLDRLEAHLEAFRGKCKAKDYRYADWDEAFMEAIRADWAGLNSAATGGGGRAAQRPLLDCDEVFSGRATA